MFTNVGGKTTKVEKINCPLCDSDKNSTIGTVPSNLGLRMARCHDCSLVFANPPPERETLEELYKPGLGRWAEEPVYRKTRMPYFRFYTGLIREYNPRSFLDIGCGTGILGEYVARELSVETAGIDISPIDCNKAKDRLGKVICANICEPGVAKWFQRTFDALVMSDVLEHLPKPHIALDNIVKLSSSSGILVIDTGNIGGFGPKLARARTPLMQDTGHITFYQPKTITKLLDDHGFSVIGIHDENEVFSNEEIEKVSIMRRVKRMVTSSPNMIVVCQKS